MEQQLNLRPTRHANTQQGSGVCERETLTFLATSPTAGPARAVAASVGASTWRQRAQWSPPVSRRSASTGLADWRSSSNAALS